MSVRFEPAGPLRGALRPPADKSISHRAALLAAMATGTSRIDNYLDAADTRSTLRAVAALGAEVVSTGLGGVPGGLEITGVGLRGARSAPIDVGNAGTLLRVLPGWLAGQPSGSWTLDGDTSIRRRPVDRIVQPLAAMGAQLRAAEGRTPPLAVQGAALRGIDYELPVASAQVKSCLLLAGLLAHGETRVREPTPSRDHTERMLSAAGAPIDCPLGADGATVAVGPAEALAPISLSVPADPSSAACWIVAATLVPGSAVRLRDVTVNPTRLGLVRILRRMGADIEVDEPAERGGEPVADIRVRSAPLRATDVGAAEVPAAIDELPLVALAAAAAEGQSTIRGAAELRHKESDRIETVAAALRALGSDVEAFEDGLAVAGSRLRGGTVHAAGDHRLAMLGAVAGLASDEGVAVEGLEAVEVSYPSFTDHLLALTGG